MLHWSGQGGEIEGQEPTQKSSRLLLYGGDGAAMRTTSTEALEIALCLPPLDRFIISTAKLSAYRLKCQSEWRGQHLCHARLSFLHEHSLCCRIEYLENPRSLKSRYLLRKIGVNQNKSASQTGKSATRMVREWKDDLELESTAQGLITRNPIP